MKTSIPWLTAAAILTVILVELARPQEPANPNGPYAHLLVNSEPVAYWQLGESEGDRASDRTAAGHHAVIEPPVVHSAVGPQRVGLCGPDVMNRCFCFAGGRLTVDLPNVGHAYSVGMWFCSEPPNDARSITGYLFCAVRKAT